MSEAQQERRRENRVQVRGRFKAIDENKKLVSGTVTNLSAGGIYLESTDSIVKGSTFLLDVEVLVAGKAQQFHARGVVVHKTLLSNDAGFGVGLKWTELSDKAKQAIKKII